jgi:TRAP-type C4-dicarboxylate transport system permease small subunit
MEVVTHVTAFAFFALLAWQGIGELRYSWEIREATMGTVRFPLYPARFLLLLGVLLLLLRLAIDIVEDLGRLRRGEPPPAPAVGIPAEG